MHIDKARQIVAHIVCQRERWGKQYDGSDWHMDQILDAIVAINGALAGVQQELVPKADLTKANRQLAASKAQYAKLKGKVADLQDDSDLLARLQAAGVDNWEGYSDA